MKVYFQVQSGRKLRVYTIDSSDDLNEKRRQRTIAVFSVDDKIPPELIDVISDEDRMRLFDTFDLMRDQIEYERVRNTLLKLPPILNKASKLLTAERLTLSEDQRQELRDAMMSFLKQLKQ